MVKCQHFQLLYNKWKLVKYHENSITRKYVPYIQFWKRNAFLSLQFGELREVKNNELQFYKPQKGFNLFNFHNLFCLIYLYIQKFIIMLNLCQKI